VSVGIGANRDRSWCLIRSLFVTPDWANACEKASHGRLLLCGSARNMTIGVYTRGIAHGYTLAWPLLLLLLLLSNDVMEPRSQSPGWPNRWSAYSACLPI